MSDTEEIFISFQKNNIMSLLEKLIQVEVLTMRNVMQPLGFQHMPRSMVYVLTTL